MKERTDKELVDMFTAGDGDAFAVLWRRHLPKLSGQVYKMLYPHNMHRMDDIMQDLAIRVFRKAHTWTGQAAYSSWLYRVAHNEVLMVMRKAATRSQEVSITHEEWDELVNKPSSECPEKALIFKQAQRTARRRFKLLSKDGRTIFVGRYIFQHQNSDHARRLGITVPAVKSRVHRGRPHMERIIRELQEAA